MGHELLRRPRVVRHQAGCEAWPGTRSRRGGRAAAAARPSAPAPGASSANSSPPMRATQSPLRATPAAAAATSRSTSSPAGWPCSSFIALEVVEVDQDQRVGLARARGALERGVERAPVAHAGERVALGHRALVAARRARGGASGSGSRPSRRPWRGRTSRAARGSRPRRPGRRRRAAWRRRTRTGRSAARRDAAGRSSEMNSAVKIITGWRKLVAPPVAHRERATIGMVVAVTSARQPTVMPRPREAIHREKRPQPTAKPAMTERDLDVLAARARKQEHRRAEEAGRGPHDARCEVRQRPVVPRVSVSVELPAEAVLQAAHPCAGASAFGK